MVIGTVLPDFVKNAQKELNLYPQKKPELFNADKNLKQILEGWKRHLEVDQIFHSSDFFIQEMAKLKQLLLPILTESPVRPSFLAHIGVELLLDHLLVLNGKININAFYDHLNEVEDQALKLFLTTSGAENTEPFFKFLNSFKSSKYLLSYQKLENISYALQRICMRLWAHPFTEENVLQLTQQLEIYKASLAKNYLDIFQEIEEKII